MSLFDQISNDIKEAMKAKDKVRLETLRNVKKVFLEAKTAPGANDTLTDDNALKLIQKLVKQGKDSAEIYKGQGRADLAEGELAQVSVLEAYLPKQMSEAERKAAVKDFALTKGLIVALLCGVMSACFALGLEAGNDIKMASLNSGVNSLFAGLPVIFLVTVGGFVTNAAYCIFMNLRNRSGHEYLDVGGRQLAVNIFFCALAGGLWYSQFFGLETGKSFLKENPVLLAFAWSILMSLNVLFSNLWGIILKEWKGCGRLAVAVLVTGLAILLFSVFFPYLSI